MIDAVLLVGLLGTSYGAFALLALSQDRHWHHLGGARRCPPPVSALLRPVAPLATASIKAAVARNLSTLKELLESKPLTRGDRDAVL